MRKILGTLAIAVLALTACSAPVESAPAPETVAATVTAAPIPAEAEAPTSQATAKGEVDIAYYVKGVRAMWPDTVATDTELVAAGKLACEQLGNGAQTADVVVVEGSPAGDKKNLAVTSAAMSVLCPELMPVPN